MPSPRCSAPGLDSVSCTTPSSGSSEGGPGSARTRRPPSRRAPAPRQPSWARPSARPPTRDCQPHGARHPERPGGGGAAGGGGAPPPQGRAGADRRGGGADTQPAGQARQGEGRGESWGIWGRSKRLRPGLRCCRRLVLGASSRCSQTLAVMACRRAPAAHLPAPPRLPPGVPAAGGEDAGLQRHGLYPQLCRLKGGGCPQQNCMLPW